MIDNHHCPLCGSEWETTFSERGGRACPSRDGFYYWSMSSVPFEKELGSITICWGLTLCMYKENDGRWVGWTVCPYLPFDITEERFRRLLTFL